MRLFNFHHHNAVLSDGIYNLGFAEAPGPQQFFSAGLHPYDVSEDWLQDFKNVEKMAKNANCLAIGECGLDGTIENPDELQAEVLKMHFKLANQVRKPVILHCVKRFELMLKLQHFCEMPLIVHGFRKNATLGKTLLEKGFYLSFGSALLQNVSLQALLAEMPLERIFIETDTSGTGIESIYRKAAELKNISLEEFVEKTEENLKRILNG